MMSYVVSQLGNQRPAKCPVGDSSSDALLATHSNQHPSLFFGSIRASPKSFYLEPTVRASQSPPRPERRPDLRRGSGKCPFAFPLPHSIARSPSFSLGLPTTDSYTTMKIVLQLSVLALLPTLGNGGRWNRNGGGGGDEFSREHAAADANQNRESRMRTVLSPGDTIHDDTDFRGFASDNEDGGAASSPASTELTIGRLLRGGLTIGGAQLPVDRTSTPSASENDAALEDGARRRGLYTMTGGATQDTLVWDPDANGGT
jgi:hypothetical protein